MSIAADPFALGKRPIESLPQADADIFRRVVIIHLQVTARFDTEVEQSVSGQQSQHVIEKADSRSHLGSTVAVEAQLERDFRFARDTSDHGFSVHMPIIPPGLCSSRRAAPIAPHFDGSWSVCTA